MRQAYGDTVAGTVVTDLGFASAKNDAALHDQQIVNATMPRNPEAMKRRLSDPVHRRLHQRRAQTEARIGIFKANFLGDHLPTKDFASQQRYIAWAALAHNLWVLARLDTAEAAIADAG